MNTITPGEYAERLGIGAPKVLGWITTGELEAIDVTTKAGSAKPRYRITPEAIAAFEQRRSSIRPSTRTMAPIRRQRMQLGSVPEYFASKPAKAA